MVKELLRWAASLLTGAAVVGLNALFTSAGTGPDVDPFIAAIAVGLVTKAVTWLISKIPVSTPTA